ncbi:MAG: MBL fold metallo-hydrolase [Phenylobacterium sp.]
MSFSATRRTLLGAGAAMLAAPRLAGAAEGESRLILLGTGGGPTPKPNRSAPANAVVVNGAVYVVDCGNGVARQLVLAGLPLNALKAVFVTHQHSDHNADYGNLLLLSWAANLTSRVETYGPPPLKEMTRLFLRMNDYDIRTRIADEGRPPLKDLISVHEVSAGGPVMADANVKVTAALVDHGAVKPALAYRFDCPDRSIVLSGDTRPSANLIKLAKGADVLVHEVMYLPAVAGMAAGETNARTLREHLLSAHTTAEEVGRVATEAGVRTLVLSHFVPGGPGITDAEWEAAVRPHFAGRLVVGRDLMEL